MKNVFDNGGYVGAVADFAKIFSLMPEFTTSGLVLSLDAGNTVSYPGTGTTWTDTSPSALTATLQNSPTFSSSGKYFTFNGSNTSAVISNNTVMDSQSITVEVWSRPNTNNQYGFWMEKGTQNSQYSIFIYGGTLYWRIWGVTDVTAYLPSYVSNNSWCHVVGTTTYGTQKLYINNAVVASGTTGGTISTSAAGFSVGMSGGYAAAGGYPFNGDIAIVRVYNRALSASEVSTNFTNYRSRFGI